MIAHRFGGRLIDRMPSRAIDLRPRLAGAVDSWNALREVECTRVFDAIHRRVDELAQLPMAAKGVVGVPVMLAPLAVLTLVFLALALLPALVLGDPMFIGHGMRDECTRFPPARLAA